MSVFGGRNGRKLKSEIACSLILLLVQVSFVWFYFQDPIRLYEYHLPRNSWNFPSFTCFNKKHEFAGVRAYLKFYAILSERMPDKHACYFAINNFRNRYLLAILQSSLFSSKCYFWKNILLKFCPFIFTLYWLLKPSLLLSWKLIERKFLRYFTKYSKSWLWLKMSAVNFLSKAVSFVSF